MAQETRAKEMLKFARKRLNKFYNLPAGLGPSSFEVPGKRSVPSSRKVKWKKYSY